MLRVYGVLCAMLLVSGAAILPAAAQDDDNPAAPVVEALGQMVDEATAESLTAFVDSVRDTVTDGDEIVAVNVVDSLKTYGLENSGDTDQGADKVLAVMMKLGDAKSPDDIKELFDADFVGFQAAEDEVMVGDADETANRLNEAADYITPREGTVQLSMVGPAAILSLDVTIGPAEDTMMFVLTADEDGDYLINVIAVVPKSEG
jgi:hypothetical protein